jgi:hypothetical protein
MEQSNKKWSTSPERNLSSSVPGNADSASHENNLALHWGDQILKYKNRDTTFTGCYIGRSAVTYFLLALKMVPHLGQTLCAFGTNQFLAVNWGCSKPKYEMSWKRAFVTALMVSTRKLPLSSVQRAFVTESTFVTALVLDWPKKFSYAFYLLELQYLGII